MAHLAFCMASPCCSCLFLLDEDPLPVVHQVRQAFRHLLLFAFRTCKFHDMSVYTSYLFPVFLLYRTIYLIFRIAGTVQQVRYRLLDVFLHVEPVQHEHCLLQDVASRFYPRRTVPCYIDSLQALPVIGLIDVVPHLLPQPLILLSCIQAAEVMLPGKAVPFCL